MDNPISMPPSNQQPEQQQEPVKKKGESFIAGVKHKFSQLKGKANVVEFRVKSAFSNVQISEPTLTRTDRKETFGRKIQKKGEPLPTVLKEVQVEPEEKEVQAPPRLGGQQKPKRPLPPDPPKLTKT